LDPFKLKQPVFANQVHGSLVKYYDNPSPPDSCDGLYTDHSGLALTIRTADCAAVMIFDPGNKMIVNLHVGWKGAREGIIDKALQIIFRDRTPGASELVVAISPMIRSCCYQVGPEFNDYFDKKYLYLRESKIFFDLPLFIKTELIKTGLSESQIEFSDECTCCSPMNLPSFRRDKTKNRMINAIVMKET
jgi:YfiH family protein